ncbi:MULTISPECIES: Tat pathway signal sequence domain protein [Streptomyces]|uniref:Tat pathway signal sequence domain protein n=1 Tax=Streptomyces TaxID=1883 RepID=UPI00143269CE|nr:MULTISPECIES: Tat pathway signal sequence domain protein [unclassified Streptomyces]MDX3089297.1 Tat pathway signal sequence domain protein [Streptomyces sp. ME12-02E]MDX3332647.1 Tat pathway signal sequence domain protein [Streptomyces sp. ME02-6978a]NJP73956.1 Tat pathway signal sequence domain protein [Streptomyces sp. C1-2]WTI29539.1 Tat pathway signal sequence domain protein [Streptomyces jietaisiensis]
MRRKVHRHLGKVVAGAAIAVAGTAAMLAVTLPGSAGASGNGNGNGAASGSPARAGAAGDAAAVPPGVVEAPPAAGKEGVGSDPLTEDETARVVKIASNPQALARTENVEGDKGPEELSVTLAEPEENELDSTSAPRRADVTYYDYKDDALVTRTVNLDTGKVESTGTQHGVQPPLSHDETVEAAQLLIADPLGAGLRADFKDATGKALTSPDQLKLDSMVYRAAPGAQPAALDKCGEHRCVRLFPKVKNGPWIDSRDLIIDLSVRKVGKLH